MQQTVERERRCLCGKNKRNATRQYIDIYSYNKTSEQSRKWDKQQAHPPEFRGTPKAQQEYTDRQVRKWFAQLIETNFTEEDTHTTLTYSNEYLPKDDEQAGNDISNFLRHIRRECKKKELPKPEALVVTEHQDEDLVNGKRAVRYHHHVVLKCGLSRDEIEACWHRNGKRLGRANADRLQKDKQSLKALANYLLKNCKRKHRYKRTRGIKDPIRPEPRDGKYTRRQIERLAKDAARLHSPEYWRRKYPGWELDVVEATYSEFLGWHISLEMYRIQPRS